MFFVGINAAGVEAVAEAEFVVEDEGRAGADAFPLFVDRCGGFVLGPRSEVGSGYVFEIMRAFAEFTLMMAAVKQIEDVIAAVVEESDDIAHPRNCDREVPSIGGLGERWEEAAAWFWEVRLSDQS